MPSLGSVAMLEESNSRQQVLYEEVGASRDSVLQSPSSSVSYPIAAQVKEAAPCSAASSRSWAGSSVGWLGSWRHRLPQIQTSPTPHAPQAVYSSACLHSSSQLHGLADQYQQLGILSTRATNGLLLIESPVPSSFCRISTAPDELDDRQSKFIWQ